MDALQKSVLGRLPLTIYVSGRFFVDENGRSVSKELIYAADWLWRVGIVDRELVRGDRPRLVYTKVESE